MPVTTQDSVATQIPTDGMIDFLFDAAKGAPDLALAQVRSLQVRGVQAFSAGTVLIGFSSLISKAQAATISFLIIGAVAYTITVVLALFLLLPSTVNGLPLPKQLWDIYSGETSVPAVKESLLQMLIRDDPTNQGRVRTTNWQAKWAVRFTAVEGVAITTALVLYHLGH